MHYLTVFCAVALCLAGCLTRAPTPDSPSGAVESKSAVAYALAETRMKFDEGYVFGQVHGGNHTAHDVKWDAGVVGKDEWVFTATSRSPGTDPPTIDVLVNDTIVASGESVNVTLYSPGPYEVDYVVHATGLWRVTWEQEIYFAVQDPALSTR